MYIEHEFTESGDVAIYVKNESRRARVMEIALSLTDDRTVGCLDGSGSCGVGTDRTSALPMITGYIGGTSTTAVNGPGLVSCLWIVQPGEELAVSASVGGTMLGVIKFCAYLNPKEGEIVKNYDNDDGDHFCLTM